MVVFAILCGFLQARQLPGTITLDGVDSLLLHLLLDLGATTQVNAFASIPNAVHVEAVAQRLEAAGLRHALATLWASKGEAGPALTIWRELAETAGDSIDSGDRAGSASASGPSHQQREVIEGAAALLKDSALCPSHLVLTHLPWLLVQGPASAHAVLVAREDLKPDDILPFLPRGQDARWRYLELLVATGRSSDPAVHTELALALIDAIIRGRKLSPEGEHQRAQAVPTHCGGPVPMHLMRSGLSVAALVSGRADPNPEATPDPALALRLSLRRHLQGSRLWDRSQVRDALSDTALHEEAAVAAAGAGDHDAVLRVLGITLGDVEGAVAYASAVLPPEEHPKLLQMMLMPGKGEAPRWDAAVHIVAALGTSLNAVEVVDSLPDVMPVEAALPLLAPLVRDKLHRRRSGQLLSGLRRSQLAARCAVRAKAEQGQVVVDVGRACLDCHLRIGGKVFVAEPRADDESEPRVVCLNCWNRREVQAPNGGGAQAHEVGTLD